MPLRSLSARGPGVGSTSFPRTGKLSGRAAKNKGQLASFGTWTQVWSVLSAPLRYLTLQIQAL